MCQWQSFATSYLHQGYRNTSEYRNDRSWRGFAMFSLFFMAKTGAKSPRSYWRAQLAARRCLGSSEAANAKSKKYLILAAYPSAK